MPSTSRRLGDLFAEFHDDLGLRVAIFTGRGEKFVFAGWDLNETSSAADEGYVADYGQGGIYGFAELPGLEKPAICAVNGYAIGAGCEILLCAALIVLIDHARFWLPETSLGVLPHIGLFLLPKTLLPVIALVSEVVPQAQLTEAARVLAGRIPRSAPCRSWPPRKPRALPGT